jgi:predicted dehydrogenase
MHRRKFVQVVSAGAVGAGATLLNVGKQAQAQGQEAVRKVPPSDQIRVGVIGPGSRGQEDMRNFLRVPGVRFLAMADVYEPRVAQVRLLTKEETPNYTDYRRLLERKDLDAIVVASPPALHGEHYTAALLSGRPVYGEKMLGFSIDHSNKIVEAARQSGKIFQTGLQYRYAPWIHEAVKRINAGEIGQVTHIYTYWHRNNNWRRPVPDPKFERLINWRMYRDSSQGLTAELGSHHIDIANWVFGALPETATGSGGIDFWKDGRETNDNVQVILRYPGGRTFFFSAITDNHKVGNQMWIYGTKGSIEVTMEDANIFYEEKPAQKPARPAAAEIIERGVRTGASFSTRGDMPYRGPGKPISVPEGEAGNPSSIAVRSFIENLRNGKRPFADEHVGWASAVSVALANKAIDEGRRINFSDHIKPEQITEANQRLHAALAV